MDESNLSEANHVLQISLCKKDCKQVWKNVLMKNSGIRDGKKALKEVANIQCSALLYP